MAHPEPKYNEKLDIESLVLRSTYEVTIHDSASAVLEYMRKRSFILSSATVPSGNDLKKGIYIEYYALSENSSVIKLDGSMQLDEDKNIYFWQDAYANIINMKERDGGLSRLIQRIITSPSINELEQSNLRPIYNEKFSISELERDKHSKRSIHDSANGILDNMKRELYMLSQTSLPNYNLDEDKIHVEFFGVSRDSSVVELEGSVVAIKEQSGRKKNNGQKIQYRWQNAYLTITNMNKNDDEISRIIKKRISST